MLAVAFFVCLGWIVSVCLHEFGHAIVAYWGGDTTVKDKGYLTLNPVKYTDLNLSLILPLFFLLIGGIALPGAAVYIDKRRLRNRWWQSAVSAAGPIASAIVTLLLALPFMLGLASPYSEYRWLWSSLAFLIHLEIFVVIINSLPIPSLDGYGVIEPWLPSELQVRVRKFSTPAVLFLFMLLWYVKPLGLFLGSLSTTIAQILAVPPEMIYAGFALFNKSSGILLVAAIGAVLLIGRVTRKPHEHWHEQGNTFSKSGRYEKAIASYDKAIEINPEFDSAWHYKGLALFRLSQFAEAIASYNRAIQINPNYYEVWYNRGLALNYSSHYEEAIASYDKAIQIKPNLELAWHYRGMALYLLHRHEEAIASYDKAIKINPNFAQAWNHRGCAFLALQQYKEALSCCNQAIKIKPNDPAAWIDRGLALTKLQRYAEAITSCKRAIKLKPDYELAWLHQGIALEKMNCFKKAFDSYEKILRIMPDNSAYHWSVQSRALVRLQRYAEAIAACDKAIQLDSKYAFAWYNKASCYAKQNIVDLAIENLKQAVNLDPYEVKAEAKTDSSFDSIRGNPLFKQLISE